ncbi:microfibrillar-associated 1 family protein [Thermovorax subterraneus]|nr:microfibrillar-associated 1 family protein [Thermovorax subterraneus]
MNKKLKAFIGSALIGGMLLGAGSLVFAQSASDASTDSGKAAVVEETPFKAGFRHGKKGFGMFFKDDILSELAEKGIISSEQVEKVKEYVEQKMEQERQQRRQQIEEALQKLVESGTITSEKKDKILAYLDEKEAQRQQEIEKVKNMTEEERKAYFEEKKSSLQKQGKYSMMQELVDKGILTEEEAKAVMEAIRPPRPVPDASTSNSEET